MNPLYLCVLYLVVHTKKGLYMPNKTLFSTDIQ